MQNTYKEAYEVLSSILSILRNIFPFSDQQFLPLKGKILPISSWTP